MLEKIRSKMILKIIFAQLRERVKLNLLKYNKNLITVIPGVIRHTMSFVTPKNFQIFRK